MAFDPLEEVALGRTGVRVTRLGFGAATIGGLYRPVPEVDAIATARHAIDIGLRYFDVAPVYGYGNSERRLGAALAALPRDAYALSTKVGRLLVDRDRITSGMDVDHQRIDGVEDYFYRDTPPVRPVFDYSRDGVLRSIEASLERLGVDRIDIAYIHDPDNHWEQAIGEAYPALEQLRAEGVLRAIGVGMNQTAMLTRFAREGDFDVLLVANRYTLLDQGALTELFPVCQDAGIAVVLGGVFNSGILADPRPGSRFGYLPAGGTAARTGPGDARDLRAPRRPAAGGGAPVLAGASRRQRDARGRPQRGPARRLPGAHAAGHPECAVGGAQGRGAAPRGRHHTRRGSLRPSPAQSQHPPRIPPDAPDHVPGPGGRRDPRGRRRWPRPRGRQPLPGGPATMAELLRSRA